MNFVSDGGTLIQNEIRDIETSENSVTCKTDGNSIRSDKLVVAAGPWSNDILAMLHYSVLLRVERGYHAHYHLTNGASLNRSVYDVQSGFIMSPMEMGVRITTGVDLNDRDAERDPIWRGNRPTLPDSLPAIGRAPNHKNVWVAFGHQHIGLMTGPITGKLIAENMNGESSDIDLTPFNPGRCIRSTKKRKPIWSP